MPSGYEVIGLFTVYPLDTIVFQFFVSCSVVSGKHTIHGLNFSPECCPFHGYNPIQESERPAKSRAVLHHEGHADGCNVSQCSQCWWASLLSASYHPSHSNSNQLKSAGTGCQEEEEKE